MALKSRIGLFGGSFDPIHMGHLLIAREAAAQLKLDEVRFIPCRVSPHKLDHPPASAEARLEMLKLATSRLPWARIDESELRQKTPSYSYMTVERARAEHPEAKLFWLLGTDQWKALPTWKEATQLSDQLEFIVFRRGDPPSPRDGWKMTPIKGDHPASSSAIREAIRNRRPTQDWLPAAVESYIKEHGLYQH